MKKFNFKILSVFLAIAIVVSGAVVVVASPREEVNALSPNYDGSDVYYFCDLYPTLTYENFSNTFSASIYHDVRWISDSEFYRDIEEHYFFTLNNRVVIIDIKTFIPETGILSELFSHFKENNCVCYELFRKRFPRHLFSRLCGYLCGKCSQRQDGRLLFSGFRGFGNKRGAVRYGLPVG